MYYLECLENSCQKMFWSKKDFTKRCPECRERIKQERDAKKGITKPPKTVVVVVEVRNCKGCGNEFEIDKKRKYRYLLYCKDCSIKKVWRRYGKM